MYFRVSQRVNGFQGVIEGQINVTNYREQVAGELQGEGEVKCVDGRTSTVGGDVVAGDEGKDYDVCNIDLQYKQR